LQEPFFAPVHQVACFLFSTHVSGKWSWCNDWDNWWKTERLWFYGVAHLVEALRYKPEGRGFYSRWSHWNFSVT
jgi:hypothetical protein